MKKIITSKIFLIIVSLITGYAAAYFPNKAMVDEVKEGLDTFSYKHVEASLLDLKTSQKTIKFIQQNNTKQAIHVQCALLRKSLMWLTPPPQKTVMGQTAESIRDDVSSAQQALSTLEKNGHCRRKPTS